MPQGGGGPYQWAEGPHQWAEGPLQRAKGPYQGADAAQDREGKLCGAVVRDKLTKRATEVYARQVRTCLLVR